MPHSDYEVESDIQLYKDCGGIYFLPTIVYIPWKKRYPGDYSWCVAWLNFVITFGKWKRKDDI